MSRNTSIHRLKDSQLRSAQKVELNDGGGLYFKRENANSANFYFRTRVTGMPTKTGLGPYPAISLQKARTLAAECKAAVAVGTSPRDIINKNKGKGLKILTFREAAEETFASKKRGLRGRNESGEWLQALVIHAYPGLKNLRCRDIKVDDIMAVLKPIWYTKYPTAKKVRSRIMATLTFAHATDAAVDLNVTDGAATLLGHHGHKVTHHPALKYKSAPKLYGSLTDSIKDLAFKFYLLTLPRGAPVRFMKWGQIKERAWHIPGAIMKGGDDFVVPLPPAAYAQLVLARQLVKSAKPDEFVFPNSKAFRHGVVTENNFNDWLKANGFSSTSHGLRSTFCDWADDNQVCDPTTADLALDHKVKGQVQKAYWRSTRFEQRYDVMEKWGQFVSSGFTINSPLIVRTEDDGTDMSLSLADIYAEQEEQ